MVAIRRIKKKQTNKRVHGTEFSRVINWRSIFDAGNEDEKVGGDGPLSREAMRRPRNPG